MVPSKQPKTIHLDVNKNYFKQEMSNDFPIRNYITETYGCAPSFLYIDDIYDENILPFLIKNAEYINSSLNGDSKPIQRDILSLYKNGFFWFKYLGYYLKISVKSESSDDEFGSGISYRLRDMGMNSSIDESDKKKNNEKKTYNLMIVMPSTLEKVDISDFNDFIVLSDNKTKVHLFIKNQYGEYTFEPISVNLPKDLDLELNYGKEFLKVDKLIQERLMEKPNGLFMFHGMPGTGKTTYIKYLADKINRDFIYIPTTMIENFTSDPNCLHTLIAKPNSVIILEDAEKAILKRQGDGMDSSAVSSLLNLSDGILSDILKTSVIVTYNCPKQDIDDALKRKGRLQAEYEFGQLSLEDSKKLAKHLKYPKKFIDQKITEPLTVSEIYNLEKEVELHDNNKPKKSDSTRVVGFSNS
jgi:SpoVK/Ycf46/Vps4 family AAA+-type ATPase